jgi:hypothetical protein
VMPSIRPMARCQAGPMESERSLGAPRSVRRDASQAQICAPFTSLKRPDYYTSLRWIWFEMHFKLARTQMITQPVCVDTLEKHLERPRANPLDLESPALVGPTGIVGRPGPLVANRSSYV